MDLISPYVNYIIAALVILALLLLVLIIWRAYSQRVRGRRGQRLAISEYHELDQTRRLVLVRRDNVEHLLLVGGTQDLVVESGIGAGASRPSVFSDPEPMRPISTRMAPRAPSYGDRQPPPLRTEAPPIHPDPRLREPS